MGEESINNVSTVFASKIVTENYLTSQLAIRHSTGSISVILIAAVNQGDRFIRLSKQSFGHVLLTCQRKSNCSLKRHNQINID
jgi:hypothetical protein